MDKKPTKHDLKWEANFQSLVESINFYRAAPLAKSKEYMWIRNQISSYNAGKLSIYRINKLNELAPNILSGQVELAIAEALRSGTKYIGKIDIQCRSHKMLTRLSSNAFDEIHKLGFSSMDSIAARFCIESLMGNNSGVLYKIYDMTGDNAESIEDLEKLLKLEKEPHSPLVDTYINYISSNIGIGNLRLAAKVLKTTNLRVLIRSGIILRDFKDLIYKSLTDVQRKVIDGNVYNELKLIEIASRLNLTRQRISEVNKKAMEKLSSPLYYTIISGKDISRIERLGATYDYELRGIKIIKDVYGMSDEYMDELLILFRLGIIGSLDEDRNIVIARVSRMSKLASENILIKKLKEAGWRDTILNNRNSIISLCSTVLR